MVSIKGMGSDNASGIAYFFVGQKLDMSTLAELSTATLAVDRPLAATTRLPTG
jgi:hypothetical protein